jgi:integrase/recombinase XerD
METKMKNIQITLKSRTSNPLQKYSNRNLELNSDEFIQHLNYYEQWLRVLGYADSTVYNFPAYLRAFLSFLESENIKSIPRIKHYHVRQFSTYLSKRLKDQTQKPLSRNYQLNYLNALKRFSRYLLDCHGIILDCSVPVIRKMVSERSWLTNGQIVSLYSSCSDGSLALMNRALLSVYYGLGLRRSEGVALDIDDIQITNRVVYVRRGKNSKERYVPMNETVQKDLERYITKSRKLLLKAKDKNQIKALFISDRGQRITGNAVYERLQHLARNAGVNSPLSLHSLRHSIATHLLMAGMKLENISAFLGHSSLESTQIYTHLLHEIH